MSPAVWVLIVAVVVIAGGIGFALLGRSKSTSAIRTKVGARIDPFTVQEPWRRYVQSALRSRSRLDAVVAQRADGPIRERLNDTIRQVDDIVARVWEAAQEGHHIASASRLADVPSLERRITATEAQINEAPEDRRAQFESSLSSLRGSVEVGRRLIAERDAAADRLHELDARLDELVVRAIEVSASNVETADIDSLRADLDALVVDVEGLRQGMAETKRVATA
jgi:hypothetical protein